MNMKKIFSILLAISLLAVGTIPAFGAVNGIFLGSDENGVNILNDRLRPGEEYYFPVLIAVQDLPPIQVTSADLKHSKLEVRVATGGKAISEATIEEKGGLAYVRILPGSKGTVNELIATVRINYRNRDTGENITVTPEMRVGYDAIPEENIASLEPGEFLELDNLTPLINSKQWEELSSLNNHRDITLSGPGWRYTVNTSKLGKRNMVVDHQPVMELTKKYPDHQMHFIGFPGSPDFEVTGKLWLDVSRLADEYNEDFYLYRCAYGRIYPLKFDYDKDAGEISFRPSQLSTYLITDKKILGFGSSSDSGSGSGSSDSSTPPQQNPDTGEPVGFPALLVAMVSLAGLGSLTVTKRRP